MNETSGSKKEGRSKPTVLIVEDETELADLYGLWLQEHYNVTVTYDGESGLEAMSPEVDVVLLDRRMPGLTGDEVLHEIKDSDYSAAVVMVTAVDADVDIIDLPIDDYVTKPITKATIYDMVNRMLRLNQAPPEVQKYHSLERRRDVLRTARHQTDVTHTDAWDKLTRRLEAAADKAGPGLAWLDDEYYRF